MNNSYKEYASKDWVNDLVNPAIAELDSLDERMTTADGEIELLQNEVVAVREATENNFTAAKGYTDEKIAAIPTPDVSGQIQDHNTNEAAHPDIRAALEAFETVVTDDIATAKQEAISAANTAATNAANAVKNELLNGAGEAYDTLKELGELINDNQDAISALETVAAGKSDKTHNHDSAYDTKGAASAALDSANAYTDGAIASATLITIADIDAICGASIVNASEVTY